MSDNVKINNTSVKLIKDDLTALDVEAFVFYARPSLALGSGYGNAISTRGGPTIKAELDKLAPIQELEAIISSAGELKAKHIIHAAGPVFQEEGITKKLKITIENALKCADKNGVRQLAFPLMGGGFYGINFDSCIIAMFDTIKQYASKNSGIEEIIICANDNREYRLFSAKFANIS